MYLFFFFVLLEEVLTGRRVSEKYAVKKNISNTLQKRIIHNNLLSRTSVTTIKIKIEIENNRNINIPHC